MPTKIEIAGVPLERVEIGGVTYTYPDPRMPLQHIELAGGLSVSHAVDGIEPLPPDPEKFPVQGAYFMENQPQEVEDIIAAGNVFVPGFGEIIKTAENDPEIRQGYERMGDILAGGDNVVHAMEHGPTGSLVDIGVKHAIAYCVLNRLGYEFHSGIIYSEGLTRLGYRFMGTLMAMPNISGVAAHKTLFVIPNTDNVKESGFKDEVPDTDIGRQNLVVRTDISNGQDEGGKLITVMPSATSEQVARDGTHWLVSPTVGTLKILSHEYRDESKGVHRRTYTQLHVGRVQGLEAAENMLWGEPRLLVDDGTLELQGQELMVGMAAGLNAASSDRNYAFLDPRQYSTEQIKAFKETGLI
jgi:hypothetical protein